MDEAAGESARGELRIGDAERDRAVADLRQQTGEGRLEPATAAPAHTEWGVLSSTKHRGGWTVPRELTAVAFWGSVELDLRHAVLMEAAVTIKAVAITGSVEIIVPRGLNVEISGTVVMGGMDDKRRADSPAPGGPVVRVICSGLWGGVTVRRKKMKAKGPPTPAFPAAPAPQPSGPTDHLPAHQTTVAIMVTDIVDHGDRHRVVDDAATPDLLLRVAIHAGEVARADNDVFGVNVSTADKLCAEAAPNGVLVSGVVADLAESSSMLTFGPPRRLHIAGREDPLRAHDAAWR